MEIVVPLSNPHKRFGHLDLVILGATLLPVALFLDPGGSSSAGTKLLLVAPGAVCLVAALVMSLTSRRNQVRQAARSAP